MPDGPASDGTAARRQVVDGTPAALVPTTDRVLTVPNLLSALRLVGIPAFLYLYLVAEADGWSLTILMASGWTDYFDGKIARKYGLTSRVGQVLDPLADRLFVVSTLLALAVRGVVPWWLAGAILLRDALLSLTLPVLRRHGYGPLPVHFLGKAATFNLLYAFPLLMAAYTWEGWFPTACRPIGWAFALWGTALYWWAGVLYVVQVRQLVAADRYGTAPADAAQTGARA
ncbi:MAG TPA: CDP-alcohol phosphatidyltransferase family protein [Mycobacteriales bacterium]|nr:CDP-alcohol phosphatidyltransferase family protein [Mycobacteriales bacterium]